MLPDLARLRLALIEAVEAAGELALRDHVPGGTTRAQVTWKAGGSPVTSADLAVDAFLRARLSEAFPLSWHSEEHPESWLGTARQPLAFVVDPIDGTRDFVGGGRDWCIVVGVLAQGRPVAGAIHLPASGETFSAHAGGGAWRNGLRLEAMPPSTAPWRANGPHPALAAMSSRHGLSLSAVGSTPALAHRLLAPLKGEADLALSRAGGHDWDIVASHAILDEAGARVLTIEGKCPQFELLGGEHPPLVAAGHKLFDEIPGFILTPAT